MKVQIQPSADRNEEERIRLLKFYEKESDQKNFGKIVEAAKFEMGLGGSGPGAKVFSTDVLRIESTSPTAPNLTLVDLPGLFGARYVELYWEFGLQMPRSMFLMSCADYETF